MISVVIPTYRSAIYLRETLLSVFAQTVLPLEIIVVDDCSPDETCNIVEEMQSGSPAVLRLIRLKKNSGGPVGPMNIGISAAEGEFIAMLDHDDLMVPVRLERALGLIKTQPEIGIVHGQLQLCDVQGNRMPINESTYQMLGNEARVFPWKIALETILTVGFRYGGAGGMLIRKAAWESVGGFSPKFKTSWDYDFAIRVLRQQWSVGYVPEILYYHRIHSDNLAARNYGRAMFDEVRQLLNDAASDPRTTSQERKMIEKLICAKAIMLAQKFRDLGMLKESLELYRISFQYKWINPRAISGMLKCGLMKYKNN